MVNFGYDKLYDKIFDNLRDKPLDFLEIGILEGLKIYIFSKYLKNANFYRIDIDINPFYNYGHSEEFLSRVKDISIVDTNKKEDIDNYKKKINIKYDVIIDDGDHDPRAICNTFDKFYEMLKPGGIYIIEDIRKPSRLNFVSKFLKKKKISFKFFIDKTQFERIKRKEDGNGIIHIYK